MTLLVGCQSTISHDTLAYLIKEAPLVPCDELTTSDEYVYYKGKLFSGRSIEYFYGFELALYYKGKKLTDEQIQGYPGLTTHFLPDKKENKKAYKAAFRKYADRGYGSFCHDDFIIMAENKLGTYKDVPELINCLKRYEKQYPGEESLACSHAHCLDALRSITGANAGNRSNDWEKWFQKYKKRQQ